MLNEFLDMHLDWKNDVILIIFYTLMLVNIGYLMEIGIESIILNAVAVLFSVLSVVAVGGLMWVLIKKFLPL